MFGVDCDARTPRPRSTRRWALSTDRARFVDDAQVPLIGHSGPTTCWTPGARSGSVRWMGAGERREDVTIRVAVTDDADAIGEVHVRAWQAAYRGVMPDEYLDGLQASERADMWRGRLARTDLTPLLVPVVDGQVVGFATFGAERPLNPAQPSSEPARGELFAINLHPQHWGKGIGRALLRRATDALADLGYTHAVLWVVPQNSRARALYESEGWAADGDETSDEILGVTVDEMRYVRPLSTP